MAVLWPTHLIIHVCSTVGDMQLLAILLLDPALASIKGTDGQGGVHHRSISQDLHHGVHNRRLLLKMTSEG